MLYHCLLLEANGTVIYYLEIHKISMGLNLGFAGKPQVFYWRESRNSESSFYRKGFLKMSL